MPSRPAPLRLESLSCTVVRGPRADGRWYWRARRGDATLWAGWATREEASAACARLTLGEQPTAAAARTVRDVVESWFADEEDRADVGQLSSRSLATRRSIARAFLRELGPVHIDTVTIATLTRYRDARLRAGRAPRTVRSELDMLVQAWRWGYERGLTPTADLPRVPLALRDTRDRYTPTREEVVAVLEHLEGWQWLAVRLLWATGCRLGEIATLRRRDVDASRAVIRVTGKTGPREVAILPRVLADLLPHLPADPEALVLGRAYGTVRTDLHEALIAACAVAGCPRWTAQALRRHATDALLEAGADPGVESAQLGHSPEVALQHYRRARDRSVRTSLEQAGLGVLPGADDDEGVVLLGVASREALERAIVDAALRGDSAEVERLVARLRGTATAQTGR